MSWESYGDEKIQLHACDWNSKKIRTNFFKFPEGCILRVWVSKRWRRILCLYAKASPHSVPELEAVLYNPLDKVDLAALANALPDAGRRERTRQCPLLGTGTEHPLGLQETTEEGRVTHAEVIALVSITKHTHQQILVSDLFNYTKIRAFKMSWMGTFLCL